MEYDKISDFYTCKNNRKLTVSHIRHNKTKTGYVSEKLSIHVRIAATALTRVTA